jgi:CBS domain-containing protein
MLGRRIEEVHPIVPLFDGLGIEFAIMSYADRLSICAVADPILVPDANTLRDHLYAAAAELRDALDLVAPHVEGPAAVGPSVATLMQTMLVTVVPTDTLATAWSLMRRHRIRHLPVVGPDFRVVGMVSHRDLLAVSPSSLDPTVARARIALSASVRVAEVMETHVSVVPAHELAANAGERMMRHKIGCLPVVDPNGRLAGIVTADDYVRWAAERMRPELTVRRTA